MKITYRPVAMLYKIVLKRYIFSYLILFFFYAGYTQETTISKYGVPVVDKMAAYLQFVKLDSLKTMVELHSAVPGIDYDLRYATRNNFMLRPMYPPATRNTFVRLPVANALKKVMDELSQKGYRVKVFDAYRPYSVTVSFWELVKDERYVADPHKGSGHNRGLAIDITLISNKTRKELDMGTGFDNFTDSAHHDFTQLPLTVLENRKLLRTTMEKYGFTAMETEWWHYFWPNDRGYEVLDLSFADLKKNIR
jgi:zinc D-Ala-D-Ala dipeptidase